MPHPLPVLLAASIAARAECPEPVDPARLEERLAAAEVRYAALEGERFAAEMDETALLVPCLDGLVPPAVGAEIERLALYRRVDRPGDGGMLRSDQTEGTTPT